MSATVDPLAAHEYVQTQWDTGAFGYRTLYGRIVARGPRTVTIEWESGLRNRVRHGDPRVKPAADMLEAAATFLPDVGPDEEGMTP